jgi:hypothetical protein
MGTLLSSEFHCKPPQISFDIPHTDFIQLDVIALKQDDINRVGL